MKTHALRFIMLFACIICCGTPVLRAQKQYVTLTTSQTIGDKFTVVVGAENGVSVDFGDGVYVPVSQDTLTGLLKGQTVTIKGPWSWNSLACEGQRLTSIDVSQAPYLKSLFCADNQLTELNLSSLTLLMDLDCSHNSLTELKISANKNLISLNCSYNKISSIDIRNQTELQNLDCSNNLMEKMSFIMNRNAQLETLNCSGNPFSNGLSVIYLGGLKNLYCVNSGLKSITVGVRDSLIENIWCDGNDLTSLNLAYCTYLKQLSCSNNKLADITYPNVKTKKDYTLISCQGNNLTFPQLLTRQNVVDYGCNYTYSPQSPIEAAKTLAAGQEFDLSAERYNTEKYIATTIKAYTQDGTPLALTTDYTTSNGKVVFKHSVADSVYLVLHSSLYPLLDLTTTTFKVESPVGIHNVPLSANGLKIQGENGVLTIESPTKQNVRIYSADGALIWSGTVSSSRQMELPQGIYLVNGKKVIL